MIAADTGTVPIKKRNLLGSRYLPFLMLQACSSFGLPLCILSTRKSPGI